MSKHNKSTTAPKDFEAGRPEQAAKQPEAKKREAVKIYCGPNIPGIAAPGTIFIKPPDIFLAHVEKCPAIKTFLVDPKRYISVKEKAAKSGSLENTQYKKVLEYLKKGA